MAQVNYSETLTANGETTGQSCIGPVVLILTGTFGSGTAQLQARAPDGDYVDVPDGSFTAAASKVFSFPAGSKNDYRISLSGATSPSLNVWIQAD